MRVKALDKLTKELESITNGIASSKDDAPNEMMVEMMKQQSTILIRHIMKRCTESESLCEDVLQEHKIWSRCMKYVTEKARAFAVNSVACIPDATVFEWAEDYYRMDDKEEAMKEIAEARKKQEEAEQRKREEEEREKIARERAIEKLSKEEGWDALSDSEKEEKIKAETRTIKSRIGKKKTAAKKTQKKTEKESLSKDIMEIPDVETEKEEKPDSHPEKVEEDLEKVDMPEENVEEKADDKKPAKNETPCIVPEDDGEQMNIFSLGMA